MEIRRLTSPSCCRRCSQISDSTIPMNPPYAIRPIPRSATANSMSFTATVSLYSAGGLTCGHGGALPRVAIGCRSALIYDCADSTRLGPAKYPAVNRRFAPSSEAGKKGVNHWLPKVPRTLTRCRGPCLDPILQPPGQGAGSLSGARWQRRPQYDRPAFVPPHR